MATTANNTNTKFAKALLGFTFSLATAFMMIIVTAIVITTGQPIILCSTLAVITLGAIIATIYFTRNLLKLA